MKIRFEESQLFDFAEKLSRSIVIRTYDNGNSNDTRRDSTPEESRMIFKVLYGGMLSMNNANANVQAVIDTCEYIGNLLMRDVVRGGDMNGYDTIYCPLKSWAEKNL